MSTRVGRVLDSERPDVFHTNGLAGFSVGVWSQARRRGIRVVHSLRDYYLMCPPSAMYRKGRNCERICARCLPFAAYRRRATQSVHAVSGVSDFILKRHIRAINVAGGILLILIGVLMVSGVWGVFMSRVGVLIQGYVTTI